MMFKLLLPLIGAILFFLEPMFSLLSPLEIQGEFYTLVPRFLILYLIFIAVYYDQIHAVIYGLVLGLLYDVFFIDIIGLYSFLYPVLCLIAGSIGKLVDQKLPVMALLALSLIVLLETLLYWFFSFISFTSIPFSAFINFRLGPSILANIVFLLVLSAGFKTLVFPRTAVRENRLNLSK